MSAPGPTINPAMASLGPFGSACFTEKAVINVLPPDNRIPTELRRALLAWYPFPRGARALFIGADLEAFAPLLEERFVQVDFQLEPDACYDFIAALNVIGDASSLHRLAIELSDALSPEGVLLVGFRNRFAMKYLCGGIDDVVKHPFDSLAGEAHGGVLGKTEMQRVLKAAGFSSFKTFYAMPDEGFAQAIYTDDFLPSSGIHDRVMPFDAYSSPLVAAEHDLYRDFVDEHLFPATANYLLLECRKEDATPPAKQIVHVALSLDRDESHAFITTLYSDSTVLKSPAYPPARTALETQHTHAHMLQERGLSAVEMRLTEEGAWMSLIHEKPFLAYLDELLPGNPEAFVAAFDILYDDILESSEGGQLSDVEAQEIWQADTSELGPILAKGLIDMVPYNAFWNNGTLRYFDQEFAVENCPAKYVLFRALRYTWIHLPHAEKSVSLSDLKKRFGLERIWDGLLRREEAFVGENRNRDRYHRIYGWANINRQAMAARREALADMAI